jgi:hypothetical protein
MTRRATDHELRGAYRVMRVQFRTRCIAERAVCHFCSGPIDWALAHPHPGSFEVHHSVPVAVRPDLELEMSLWRASHRLCNGVGEAAYYPDLGDGAPDTGVPSEDWS